MNYGKKKAAKKQKKINIQIYNAGKTYRRPAF